VVANLNTNKKPVGKDGIIKVTKNVIIPKPTGFKRLRKAAKLSSKFLLNQHQISIAAAAAFFLSLFSLTRSAEASSWCLSAYQLLASGRQCVIYI